MLKDILDVEIKPGDIVTAARDGRELELGVYLGPSSKKNAIADVLWLRKDARDFSITSLRDVTRVFYNTGNKFKGFVHKPDDSWDDKIAVKHGVVLYMKEFFQDEIQGEWTVMRKKLKGKADTYVVFDNPEDAMLFKLTFGVKE